MNSVGISDLPCSSKSVRLRGSFFVFVIVAGLISALWFSGVAIQGLDAHHQGFMGRAAIDIFDGRTLYAESWSFYQPLPQYINALSLVLFGDKLASLQYMTVIGYSVCGMGVAMLAHRLAGYRAAFLAVAIFLAASPEAVQFLSAKRLSRPMWELEMVMLPWPSVWALAFGLFAMVVGIQIVDAEEPRHKSILVLGILIGLTAASRLFSGVFLLVAAILSLTIMCQRTKPHHVLLLFAVSTVTLVLFYLPSLGKMTPVDLWTMQITEAADFFAKDKRIFGIALTYLEYFSATVKITSTIFAALLLVAAGYAKDFRAFLVVSLNALVTALFVNAMYWILISPDAAWSQILSTYSGRTVLAMGFAIATGLSILRYRQFGNKKKWIPVAAAGSLATALLLSMMLIPRTISLQAISESQDAWPSILITFSALSVYAFFYTVVADGRAWLNSHDKGLLAAIFLGISAISQLFPIFEARHIFWACIPLVTVAVAAALRPTTSAPVGALNSLVLTLMLLAPFTATAIGYYERQVTPRVQLASASTFLDGLMIDPETNSWLMPLLQSVEQYEQRHPQTPIIFFGHNIAYGLVAQNRIVPNRYATKYFKYSEPFETAAIAKFVSEHKPIFWLEGPTLGLASDRRFVPAEYCNIGSAPAVKNVQPFGSIILAPCRTD